MSDDLIDWFKEGDGFHQGTKAPHKWVLQAHSEIIRLRRRIAELEAALKLHQDLDAINVAEVARLNAELQKQSTLMDMGFAEYERRLATARRDALAPIQAIKDAMDDGCFSDAYAMIRALIAQEEPTT